jgi:hypothetical protein
MVAGVFSEPQELFKRLANSPQWVGAMVLMVALAVTFSTAWAINVNAIDLATQQLSKMPQLSGPQLEKAIEVSAKAMTIGAPIGALFATPIVYYLLGLVYWAIGLISREDPIWKPSYSHCLVAAVVPGLAVVPYYLLGIIMAILNPVGTHTPDQIIPSTLSYWLRSDSPKLSALYSSVDLFQIVQYAIIFFAAKYAMRAKTWGAALCVALSLLMVGVKILLAK